MGQLTNQYVSQSYQGLLKLDDSSTGVTSTLQYVQDGVGNNIPIQVSTSSVVITGSFFGDGSGLTGVTAVVDSGSLVTTSSFNAYTSSNDSRVDALELETGSLQNQIDGKLDTGSFNTYTSSNDARVDALINATGSYATTSSLTSLSQSIAVTDLAQDGRLNSLESATSSLQNQINQKLDTGSFDTYSGNTLNLINQKLDSGSFNAYTSSNDAKVNSLINATGSYATTGSNVFKGNQTISGSIDVSGGVINADPILGINTDYITSLTGDINLLPLVGEQVNVVGDVNITGSLFVTNEITALSASITYLETIYQTSSVIFTSGSNILGDEPSDVQTLNGRVDIPLGNLNVTGATTSSLGFFGNLQGTASYASNALSSSHSVNADTASYVLNAVSSSYSDFAVSSSQAQNAVSASHSVNSDSSISSSFAQNAVSASYAPFDSSSFATTGSNLFLGNQTITGSVNITGSLINNNITYPSTDGSAGQIITTNGSGSLSFIDIAATNITTITEAVRYGENITVGDPLYVSGSSGTRPIVFKADAADPSKMPVIYVASSTATANTNTTAIALGLITNVTTTGYPDGTLIYVGEGGGWSASRPTGSTSIVQPLGIVTKEGPGGSGRGLVLNPGPVLLPNIQEGYVWVGDGTNQPIEIATSSLSVASAVSASFAQNAESASWAPMPDVSIYTTTASFNAYTSSTDARLNSIEGVTGSYATTGSNTFLGNQTITGSVSLINGNLKVLSNNTTLNPDLFLTNSLAGQANIVRGWGDNPAAAGPGATQANYTGSYMINGSNNIVTLPSLRAVAQNGTADQQGYISGSANMIMGNTGGIFLNTASLLIPKTQGNIISNGSAIYMNYTTSSLAAGQPTISNNFMNGGSAILNHPSGSGNFNANILTNGNLTSTQNFTSNNRVTIVANTINNGVTLNNISSSISYQNNFNNSPITINNHLSSSGLVAGNLLAFNNNTVLGGSSNTGLSVWVSGSQASQVNRNIIDNLIGGKNIIISSSFVSSSAANLQASLIYGQNLTVSASHITPGGSAFLGRFNDATTLHLAQDIVFAVGTGTGTATRRTGLYVTSGSLVGISGSLDVKGGATTITGSVQGNVLPLTVASNTASLNLNDGNFFVLQLTGSQDIRIEPSNIKPGQTVNVKLNTTGSGTVSFPSSVKQISGSAYVPTTEVSTDIITLVSFDTTSLFLANVKNLI